MARFRTIAVFVLVSALAGTATAASRSPSPADLIRAAKAARLSDIDFARKSCGDHRTVEQWLKQTTGRSVRSIRWTGGACTIVNKDNPRDAGTKWCARADVTPRAGDIPATVEVFFDRPRHGRPGRAFAFRAVVQTKDGWDTMRETSAFEANWGETHVPGYQPSQNGCR